MNSPNSSVQGYQEYGLLQQGYDYGPNELTQLTWGLRFTPMACMGLALAGLFLENPGIHFALAVLGIIPFWFPTGHPIDMLYNRVLRPLWNGIVLPPNPLPRRIACFMGGLMNLTIGLFFVFEMRMWAFSFGAILISLQLVVISTHFCLASWLFEHGLKLIGKWELPATREDYERTMDSNAVLIDIRGPEEFAEEHLQNAVNISMENLDRQLQDKTKAYLLYCKSGMRSQKAAKKLKEKGFKSVLDLGSMDRVKGWLKK